MPAISFQSVSKIYDTARGPFQALDGVRFDIEEGEFFGLLGPAAVHGQLFELYSHPLAGFSKCGNSFSSCRPLYSVAGLLPSTGFFQSNAVSRFGT